MTEKEKPRAMIGDIPVWCAHDEIIPIEDLVPNPRNPNTHPRRQIEILAKIINHQGWRGPITISTRSGFIVRGHGRRLAAIKAGQSKVPVDYQHYKDEAAEWADLLADNKIAEFSEFDADYLKNILSELDEAQIDFELAGFISEEVDNILLDLTKGKTHEDDVPDIPEEVEPQTRYGDVWMLGMHCLLCGDAGKKEDVGRLMGGEKAAMVFTDPPYNVDYTGGTNKRMKIKNDCLKKDAFRKLLLDAYSNMLAHTVNGGGCYICHSDAEWEAFRHGMVGAGWALKQCLVWVKDHFVMGRQDYQWKHEPILYGWKPGGAHRWYGNRKQPTVIESLDDALVISEEGDVTELTFNVGIQSIVIRVPSYEIIYNNDDHLSSLWRFPKPLKNTDHPTKKPVALIERAIKNSSRRCEIVLDLFGGSGSTLIACEKTDRKCRIMELDPHYCDVIIKRWENYTGKKAERAS